MSANRTAATHRHDAAAARRKAFVDAAREAFFLNGYGGTTMSSIAAAVGGSKTTLWSYFSSKEELFAAVTDDVIAHYGRSLSVQLAPDADVLETLRNFASKLMSTMLAPQMLALHRLVVGEAARFPHLAEMFYERGPRRGKARLTAYFAELMARGNLAEGDPGLAVAQFVGLCQSTRYQLATLGIGSTDAAALEDELDAAVATFIHYWAGPSLRAAAVKEGDIS